MAYAKLKKGKTINVTINWHRENASNKGCQGARNDKAGGYHGFRSYSEKPPIASSRGGREKVKKRFTLNSLK
jgi:hypothetical protein